MERSADRRDQRQQQQSSSEPGHRLSYRQNRAEAKEERSSLVVGPFGPLQIARPRQPLRAPEGAISRLLVLDGPVEYFFNCQSTPESRAAIDGACNQVLGTLERL